LKGKDQKVIVIDKEENEDSDIKNFDSIMRLLDVIVLKCPVPLGQLEMNDFVWLLLNIRAKSQGDIIELVARCKNSTCNEKNDLPIDIFKDLKVDKEKKNNVVKVSENTSLMLGSLTIMDYKNLLEYVKEDRVITGVASSIKNVDFKGEIVDVDLPTKLIIVSELTEQLLKEISDYLLKANKEFRLEKTIKCKKCGVESKYEFDSLEIINFF
jgi:hypothetical protein